MYQNLLKPLIDFFGALFLLLFVGPILLLLMVLIYIESPGNPIFTQERVGQGAKGFLMFKLRSMVVGADKLGSHQTQTNDSRITKVGKFIRKTSLDELPQLLNVLKGDMSFIGPRPDVFVQREMYTQEEWDKRLSVKPGITGLAQVTGRSTLESHQVRTKIDLEYVEHLNFIMDIRVVFKTVFVLVSLSKAN